MSSRSSRDFPVGCATLFGGIAVIIAAIIPYWLGIGPFARTTVDSPTVIAISTPGANTKVARQPTYPPLPTYTPYPEQPTYTPYPTEAQPVVVATRAPLIFTTTPGAQEQDPPPGSVMPWGTRFTKSGIAIYTQSQIKAGPDEFCFLEGLEVENNKGKDYVLRYSLDKIHIKDDMGRQYALAGNYADLNKIQQWTIEAGKSTDLSNRNPWLCFSGIIDQGAKHLFLTVDDLASLSDLNWKYDLE